MKYRRLGFITLGLWIAFFSFSAMYSLANAQNADIPSSADPARALLKTIPSQDKGQEPSTPVQSPDIRIEVPEGAETISLILQDVLFEGLNAYPPETFEPYYKLSLGQPITVADLYRLIGRVQRKYTEDGYTLTKVSLPAQNFDHGRAYIKITESYISEIEYATDLLVSSAIRDAADTLQAMRPLNLKRMERIMLILNDIPGSDVGAVLARPKDDNAPEGALRLVFHKRESVHNYGRIEIDNSGSSYIGPWQTQTRLWAHGFGTPHGLFEASGNFSLPLDEQKSGSLAYSLPLLGASGLQASLQASRTITEPGSSLSTLDIKGAAESINMRFSYPLIRQREQTLRLYGNFEWKNARTKLLGEELYDDRLRILSAGLNYSFADTWAGVNIVNLEYAHGINMFGVREKGSVDLSRETGRPDFGKAALYMARVQRLPENFELFASFSGQYTNHTLLSSEEFGFGGGDVGRGYDSSEILGDQGISVSLEARYNWDYSILDQQFKIQPFVFYDFGKVWNIDVNAKDKVSAASAGFGTRFMLENGWQGSVTFASPLTKSASKEPKYQNDLGARVLFSLNLSF